MLNQIVRPLVRQAATKGARSYHPPSTLKNTTMDDLPKPQGSWQKYHEEQQKKFNMQLIAGIALFTATFTFAQLNGFLYLNYYPPTPKEEK
ncbi:uncharacterized protein LOC107266264 [Cephus cinctus]|uniref:Uncharacterized protein LOC107266264 n=1 Tax=Cephus cinctus TaxID=211228 RepID=A0AAJ7FHG3_CEPCN|nr:uncharacterized protein LOC107266264 [Cephus cinctus]